MRAEQHRANFDQLYAEIWSKKKDHLDKMQASELYKRKSSHSRLKNDQKSMFASKRGKSAGRSNMSRPFVPCETGGENTIG